jgi:GNAT superfamily N-acetyltransferase
MQVVDLSEKYLDSYLMCLEDWSDEIREVIPVKKRWYDKMKAKGLRVKLALDDTGVVGGMIQYFPIEHAWVKGKDLYFIGCIWVHGYKQGRGDFRGKGMGKAMLQAAEEDVRQLGSKGLVAWGIPLPVWMKASWYKKQGYKPVDRNGFLGEVLLWKTFSEDAEPPKWVKQKKRPDVASDKVTVTCLNNGWCPAQNLTCQRAKKVAAEFGDDVEVVEVDTFSKDNFEEWGTSDAVYVDRKKVMAGPPPSPEKIRKIIQKKVQSKK